MSDSTANSVPAPASAGAAGPGSQHTRPDKKRARVRTHRCEIRLTSAERSELLHRAAGQELSTWLRTLALGQPPVARRAPTRRRRLARATGSLAEQQQARALLSLAQSLGGLVDRMRPGTPRDQVAKLVEYVRKKWEGLPC